MHFELLRRKFAKCCRVPPLKPPEASVHMYAIVSFIQNFEFLVNAPGVERNSVGRDSGIKSRTLHFVN